jgi:hypothetical protein
MKAIYLSSLLLLSSLLFSQQSSSAPTEKLPDVPVTYQDKFKTAIIKLQSAQLDENQLSAKFQQDEKDKTAAQAEAADIESKLLTELKLDPKKYTVQYKDNKVQIVAKEAPASKQ